MQDVIEPGYKYQLAGMEATGLKIDLAAAQEVARIAQEYARADVNWAVHVNDGGMADRDDASARQHYLADSESGMRNIFEAMIATRKTGFNHILDMPSGYGRLMRHLRAAFPNAEITACDITEEAVHFCAQEFGAVPMLSQTEIAAVDFGGKTFDLIWSGSFFTHLPLHRFTEALDLFCRALSPGGIAILTMHGRFSATYGEGVYLPSALFRNAARTYPVTGFGYADYPHAYSKNEYGISLSSPSFVTKALEADRSVSLVSYIERGWSDHQDVVVLKKQDVLRQR